MDELPLKLADKDMQRLQMQIAQDMRHTGDEKSDKTELLLVGKDKMAYPVQREPGEERDKCQDNQEVDMVLSHMQTTLPLLNKNKQLGRQ